VRDDGIDDGDVAPLRAAVARIDQHLEQLVGPQRPRGVDAPGGIEPGGQPGDGGLAHLGEGVVGAGGQAGDRRGVGPAPRGIDQFAHHRAVRAVATQHDDGPAAGGQQLPGGGEAVLDRGRGLEIQPGDGRQAGVATPQMPLQQRADAPAVGHQQCARHPGGARGLQHAQQDVHAVGDLQVAGLGDDAADVARRHRVGDHAEQRG
jgi:hypothetical protein